MDHMDHPVPSFSQFLAEHKRGELELEAAHKLAELTEACQETGKSGSLTLTIKVAAPKPGSRTVNIAATTKLTKPEHSPEISTYFVGPGGALERDDPSQLAFGDLVRRVDPMTGEVSGLGG